MVHHEEPRAAVAGRFNDRTPSGRQRTALPKCIQILSYKYSGSTALQSLLSRLPGVNTAPFSEHVHNETLFWSKAASILGLPQYDMYNSQTPINKESALSSFNRFISRNLGAPPRRAYHKNNILELWGKLCAVNAPTFLEKSPHHLFQPAVVNLMQECITFHAGAVDSLILGLVRNPNAMLYSDYKRRGSDPSVNQHVWRRSYENLLELRRGRTTPLLIVKYEEVVRDLSVLDDAVAFAGHKPGSLPTGFLHAESVDRWRSDKSYTFELSPEVSSVAAKFGYTDGDLRRAR